jgi:hypothetical protein
MHPRRSSFPLALAGPLPFVGLALCGCAHAPAVPQSADPPPWVVAAPSSRKLELRAAEQRRCRIEVPVGSRVARRVCTTREEDRLRAEAAAEHVRWGTRPTF